MTQRDDIDQIGGENLSPHFGQAHRVERLKLIVFLLKQMKVICSIIVDMIFNITRPFEAFLSCLGYHKADDCAINYIYYIYTKTHCNSSVFILPNLAY